MSSTNSSESINRHLERGSELKNRAIMLANTLRHKASEAELQQPPAVFQRELDRLQHDEYRVVVVGEIKKGKSCFLNALIGKKLLPEDVPVSTCQAFRIAHAECEAYRLRFEDGSAQDIRVDELQIYGSQVLVDAGATPTLDKIIRWIEIDIPFELIPKNIVLFDTPGLGGLNSEHRDITYGILERALPDAVLFVLDSMAPINNIELKAVERIATHYFIPHIFFLQTKVDLRESKWMEIRDKSLLNLRTTLGNKLGPLSISPIASKRLQDAAVLFKQGAEKKTAAGRALEDSRLPEFLPALMSFLYRIIGWSRASNVAQLASGYQHFGHHEFSARLKTIDDETGKMREEHLQKAWAKKHLFTETSTEWQQLISRVRREFKSHASEASHRFQQTFDMIEFEAQDDIEAVSSVSELQYVADELDQQMLRAASDSWLDIKDRLTEYVAISLVEITNMSDPELADFDNVDVNVALPPLQIGANLSQRIMSAGRSATTGGAIFGVVPAAVLGALGLLIPPVAVALAATGLAGTIWGLMSGMKEGAKADVNAGRGKLLNRLRRLCSTIRPHYSNEFSKLLRVLEQSLEGAIQETSTRKSREADSEIKRLQSEAKLSEAEREQHRNLAVTQLQEWSSLRIECDELRTMLDALHQSLEVREVFKTAG